MRLLEKNLVVSSEDQKEGWGRGRGVLSSSLTLYEL